jgi:hypothetical protein
MLITSEAMFAGAEAHSIKLKDGNKWEFVVLSFLPVKGTQTIHFRVNSDDKIINVSELREKVNYLLDYELNPDRRDILLFRSKLISVRLKK